MAELEQARFAVVMWHVEVRRAEWRSVSEKLDRFGGGGIQRAEAIVVFGAIENIPTEWRSDDLRHFVSIKTGVDPSAIAVCEVARG